MSLLFAEGKVKVHPLRLESSGLEGILAGMKDLTDEKHRSNLCCCDRTFFLFTSAKYSHVRGVAACKIKDVRVYL